MDRPVNSLNRPSAESLYPVPTSHEVLQTWKRPRLGDADYEATDAGNDRA
jgi:hypothetical protein